jgi:PAS domain S-box-containing protein
VALAKASFEHGDAMLRELTLLSFGDDLDNPAMGPIVPPSIDLDELLSTVDALLDRGVRSADIEVSFPAAAAHGAVDRLALVDEADRLSEDGQLLLPAALPEIQHLRRWLFGEIARQAEGSPPTGWAMPSPAGALTGFASLSPDEVDILGAAAAWSIVADQQNRIVFVGDEAAELFGWEASELTGLRVTAIVPPELREAHLVGFTRYQLTGEPTILGRSVPLRGRRRDGSDVAITILIRALPRRAGRLRYWATVAPDR